MLALYLLTLAYSVAQITDLTVSPDPMLVGEQAKIECRISEADKVAKASLDIQWPDENGNDTSRKWVVSVGAGSSH